MEKFQAQSPNYKQIIKESFEKQTFLVLIGAKLTKISPGEIEIEVKDNKKLYQQDGFFHAGVTSTLADVSMGYAALSLASDNSRVLTTEFKINLLSPAVGDKLIARSEVVKFGKLLKICKSSVYTKSKEEKLCAISTGTMLISLAEN